jgi:hypothetical protein
MAKRCLGVNPQIELQLLVDAVRPLVVPLEPLDVAQVQKTQTKSPFAAIVGQA